MFELKKGGHRLGKFTISVTNMPPRIFDLLFTQYLDHAFGGQQLVLKTTHPNKDTIKTTSRNGGKVPYVFMSRKFNKGLFWVQKGNDQIVRDVKEFNVTYTLPLGNLTVECIVCVQVPGSQSLQSLQ